METSNNVCDNCKVNTAKPQMCNGDHKWHWHGGVHRKGINGNRASLQNLCDNCYEIDIDEWQQK